VVKLDRVSNGSLIAAVKILGGPLALQLQKLTLGMTGLLEEMPNLCLEINLPFPEINHNTTITKLFILSATRIPSFSCSVLNNDSLPVSNLKNVRIS